MKIWSDQLDTFVHIIIECVSSILGCERTEDQNIASVDTLCCPRKGSTTLKVLQLHII